MILHVVDLDGARAGEPTQLGIVGKITAAIRSGATVEAAGGIRLIRDVDAAFGASAGRVVLGTAALQDPGLVRDAVAAHGPESIVIAVDVRDGRAAGNAWEGAAGPFAADVIRAMTDVGAVWFEVTAIDRDGLLGGPDLALLDALGRLGRGRLVASAGSRSIADLSPCAISAAPGPSSAARSTRERSISAKRSRSWRQADAASANRVSGRRSSRLTSCGRRSPSRRCARGRLRSGPARP